MSEKLVRLCSVAAVASHPYDSGNVRRSRARFVLVALAVNADDDGRAHVSTVPCVDGRAGLEFCAGCASGSA